MRDPVFFFSYLFIGGGVEPPITQPRERTVYWKEALLRLCVEHLKGDGSVPWDVDDDGKRVVDGKYVIFLFPFPYICPCIAKESSGNPVQPHPVDMRWLETHSFIFYETTSAPTVEPAPTSSPAWGGLEPAPPQGIFIPLFVSFTSSTVCLFLCIYIFSYDTLSLFFLLFL